jgi:type I restriction enzyme S subunit
LPEFLYFWLRSNKPYLDRVANATTYDALNRYDLFEFKIGIPKIKEQQKIINFLKSLDEKIQSNLKIKKIIISSLFLIYKNCLYRNKKNNLKDWKKIKFNEIATTQGGFSYRSIDKSEDSTHHVFVTLKNISMSGEFKTEYSRINSSRLKERHFVKELDLVIANTHFGVGGSDFGRLLATPALIIFPDSYLKSNAVFSLDVSKILIKKDNIKYFLYFLFLDKHLEMASKYHTGTGVQHFDYKSFEAEYEIILPPDVLLEEFEKRCTISYEKVLNLEKQIIILEKCRSLLQRKLVYGKIRLK